MVAADLFSERQHASVVLALDGGQQLVVTGGSGLRLRDLAGFIPAVSREATRAEDDAGDHPEAVGAHPFLDAFPLFLIVQFAHIGLLRNSSTRATSSLTGCSVCADSPRSGLSAITPRSSSSSPSTRARPAPDSSARRNCVLNFPPPQWTTMPRPGNASRRSSANLRAARWARSPCASTKTSGGATAGAVPAWRTSSTTRSTPIAKPMAG